MHARWNEEKVLGFWSHGPGFPQYTFGVGVGERWEPPAKSKSFKDLAHVVVKSPLDDFFTWTVTCQDGRLEAFRDGERVVLVNGVQHSASGAISLGAEGEAIFQRVEYAVLDEIDRSDSPAQSRPSRRSRWATRIAPPPPGR
jgi:hypothetical protein